MCRQKALVDFHTFYLGAGFRQGLGQGTNARTDFQYQVPRSNLGSLGNGLHHLFINEEILAKALLGLQPKGLQNIMGHFPTGNDRMQHTVPPYFSSSATWATAWRNSSRVMP